MPPAFAPYLFACDSGQGRHFYRMESMVNRAEEIIVAGLCGSLGEDSVTRRALQVVLAGAEEAQARTVLVDLREWTLPFCGAPFSPEQFPDVARLRDTIRGAQGMIWATPEYHGSFSGVLKNALDLLAIDDFNGKMVGLLGVAAGSMGAGQALSHLRVVGRQLHAWVLPAQVSLASSYSAFNPDGTLKSTDLDKRLREMGRDVARFAQLHASSSSAL